MLLLAAGRGTRFGGDVPKAYLPLAGTAVLVHSARRLARVADPRAGHQLVVVVAAADRPSHLRAVRSELEALGARLVDGGESRQQSMAAGLAALAADCDLVLVHDAARPLFDVDQARECVRRAAECGAALLAAPAADTLKRVGDDGRVVATVDRRGIYGAQTPQVVRRELLVRALDHAREHGLDATDDVGLVEAIGGAVAVVPSTSTNLKITRRQDLAVAEALLAAAETTR